ncbi:flagellar export protein FliJ [Solimonas terrae]|uniref:Flagellar FliJ protein n=1 Tax=Solimonas terrae TaxID=1396819 RepID=A0A6M2BXQ3_9GAMM|nr:flagellar export protein FliJ [Solimonas terrae]NGY06913.1 flagellar export protein FliJ [Solimonas terrae]
MGQMMQSKRMQPLQQLADIRQDDAARQLVEAQRQQADREARLLELSRYREDYERQNAAATPQLLRNRQAFLDRLREAERFQQQLVEQAVRSVDECRAHWLLQQRGSRTVAQLTACYQAREQREEARREQGRLDEFAMHKFVRAGD